MRINAIVLISTILTACVIDPIAENKSLPPQDNVALLYGARYINHNSSELTFDARIVVLNTFYEGFNNDYLEYGNFEIDGAGSYEIESFNCVEIAGPDKPSSMIFLVDQSNSYLTMDPYNSRSQAIHKFLRDITPPNKFLVGACARQGLLSTEPMELYSNDFDNDWEGSSNYLFELSQRTGGMSAIWDGADLAMERLIEDPDDARKELVLLVHGEDANSITTVDNLIAKAREYDISTHVIALGSDFKMDDFARLAQETGGFSAACSTDKQMIKVFNELDRLLHQASYVYTLRKKCKPSVDLLSPGSSSLHTIKLNDPFTDLVYNSVYLKIIIPF